MANILLNHDDPEYIRKRNALRTGRNNGGYWYSREICKNIIPRVKTNRPWVTLRVGDRCADGAIFFVHANTDWEIKLGWLRRYKDLILVVSSPATQRWCEENVPEAHTIFIPLSIDTEYVKTFQTKKNKETCYAGNAWYFQSEYIGRNVPYGTKKFINLERDDLLRAMAPFRKVYAIGRTALEAKVLGCEILPFDDRYPDPEFWKLIDNREAAEMLQEELDKIDKKQTEAVDRKRKV